MEIAWWPALRELCADQPPVPSLELNFLNVLGSFAVAEDALKFRGGFFRCGLRRGIRR